MYVCMYVCMYVTYSYLLYLPIIGTVVTQLCTVNILRATTTTFQYSMYVCMYMSTIRSIHECVCAFCHNKLKVFKAAGGAWLSSAVLAPTIAVSALCIALIRLLPIKFKKSKVRI